SRHIKYPDSSRLPQNNNTPNPNAGRRPSMTPLAQSQSSQQSSTNPTPTSSTLNGAQQRAVSPTNNAQGRGSPITQRATSPTINNNNNSNPRSSPNVSAAQRAVSPPGSNNPTPTRQGATSPTNNANNTSISQRAISPQQQRSMSPTTNAGQRAVSPTTTAESERASSPSSRNVIKPPNGAITTLGAGGAAMAASGGSPSLGRSTREGSVPPQRPRREDDSSFTIDRSDEDSTPSTITNNTVTEKSRAMSPNTSRLAGAPSVEALRSNGLAARSPSPVVTAPPPSDAFYPTGGGTKSPQTNGFPQGHAHRGSAGSINTSPETLILLKQKEVELEAMKRRENWMKAALSQATKMGFVWSNVDVELDENVVGGWLNGNGEEEGSENGSSVGGNGGGAAKMAEMVMRMKQERAKLQNLIVAQARAASERFAEADRVRNSALQEAALSRAKLSAYEANLPTEVNRLERERLSQLESQLQQLLSEHMSQERKMDELVDSYTSQTRLKEQAEDRANDAVKRAEFAENAHEKVLREHSELIEKHALLEGSLRDHIDRLLSLSSATQQKDADNAALSRLVEELTLSRDQHQRAWEQAQAALLAAAARADEIDAQWSRGKEQISQLEQEVNDLRNDLETKIQEAESATSRLTDVENAWAKSREEADAYRALTTGGLGQLLDSQREMLADEDRATRGHAEKLRAMELEASSLRKMLKEAGVRVDAAQNELSEYKKRSHGTESESLVLRSQLNGLRGQLTVALQDVGRLRKDLAMRDAELREKSKLASENEVRLGMLKNYLADNGLVLSEDDLNASSGTSGGRLHDLQLKLQQKTRQHEETEMRLQEILREKEDAESRSMMLNSELERMRSARSPSSVEDASGRAVSLERKLAEVEQMHRQKMAKLENDYHQAVNFAKTSERVIRRVKDELNKQKSVNQSLQSDLDAARGVNTSEAGSRTRNANGRNTPLSDEDGPRVVEAQRQVHRLQLENQDLRRRVEALQSELEEVRDNLVAAQRASEARLQHAEDLEAEVERLENVMKLNRNGAHDESFTEQLAAENNALKNENKMLSDKINLLLEVDQPGFDTTRRTSTLSNRRPASQSSSENAMALESLSNEIDDWQRRLASSTSSHRPLSDYDDTPRHLGLNDSRLR
ncbi:Negative regulator of mitotic exit, partial [Tulasnella sp. 419]